ncbi:hypothetical protein IQ273_12845 [Nodosilinea sp. LEGE 07298]|uniref:hypothetical protein n=1 Tax=Nodosilinea sp. LEGE 07298 TaxID=2777970 RepID=UPI00187E349A|nr:hypothetical protein [Nodosilinea sp. LEGE 07298]MBE9110300.1 hypothetical protein [Nodosilinea sp. LEGE 07298]
MSNSLVVGGHYVTPTADISKAVAIIAGDAEATHLATVPAGESWEVLGVVATVTTTAAVGNRTHSAQVLGPNDEVFYQTAVGANLAASQTAATRSFLIGGSPALAANMFVPSGGKVRVKDLAAIDEADPADVIAIKVLARRHFEA